MDSAAEGQVTVTQVAYAAFDFATANLMLADDKLDESSKVANNSRRDAAASVLLSGKGVGVDALSAIDEAEFRRLAVGASLADDVVDKASSFLYADGDLGLAARYGGVVDQLSTELACSQCCGAVLITVGGVLAIPGAPTIAGAALVLGVIGIAGSC
ncbi:hypothetical protein [Paractinoplanes globisporus]|uniref:Uncharacterized protein n=1 Tax=Paractinoplanes globisporus TaxID=113565 RepID=A0ABW6WMC8_9ACTN|nr:hypothetical protein [Actinoplanes globisporus]